MMETKTSTAKTLVIILTEGKFVAVMFIATRECETVNLYNPKVSTHRYPTNFIK